MYGDRCVCVRGVCPHTPPFTAILSDTVCTELKASAAKCVATTNTRLPGDIVTPEQVYEKAGGHINYTTAIYSFMNKNRANTVSRDEKGDLSKVPESKGSTKDACKMTRIM